MENSNKAIALHRCNQFVGRTTNWLYDHLLHAIQYRHVVCCNKLAHRDEFPGLEDWHLRPSLTRRLWRRFRGHRLFPREEKKLRTLAPDVFHSHFGNEALGDFDLQRIVNAPWVVSFYGADIYRYKPGLGELYAPVFENASAILALGPAMKTRIEKFGCPSHKIITHPLGVDAESLPSKRRLLTKGGTLKILFAGTFREKKGVPYLIEALHLARRAGVACELTLVGNAGGKIDDRKTKESIFRQIRRFNLESVIQHRPFLPFRDLIDTALQSHVFVAPSVTAEDGDAEGTPFVIQQMMATGMPVITTEHSDIPYLFGNYRNLLVPERDSRAIAYRLQEYAEDPAKLVTDGRDMRDRIRDALDIRKCAAHLSQIYDSLNGRSRLEMSEIRHAAAL